MEGGLQRKKENEFMGLNGEWAASWLLGRTELLDCLFVCVCVSGAAFVV